MSEYERFEAVQGDPWSTDPVGDYARQPRESESEPSRDDSQVLARMPNVGDDASGDQYRQYGHSGSHSRRRRSSSARPGVPAPVWVVVGMGLVLVIGAPFVMWKNSSSETALDEPAWGEMPAPDADIAPTWSAGDADSSWPPAQEAAPATMVTAEPTAPGNWGNATDLTAAPANAPYAYNAGDSASPAPVDYSGTNRETSPAPYPSADPPIVQAPAGSWGSNVSPGYPEAPSGSQSGYPATAGVPASSWRDRASSPAATPSYGTNQPSPAGAPQEPLGPASSIATPQPEGMTPGYGNYPALQTNPYVGNTSQAAAAPSANYQVPLGANAAPQYQAPAPNYAAGTGPSASLYPAPNYPQTAMSSQAPVPTSSVPAAGGSTYPAQSLAPPNTYQPSTTTPYSPQTTPTAPAAQPYYGTGVSSGASRQSVARLNGTIQEPVARQAYNDSAQPSYY